MLVPQFFSTGIMPGEILHQNQKVTQGQPPIPVKYLMQCAVMNQWCSDQSSELTGKHLRPWWKKTEVCHHPQLPPKNQGYHPRWRHNSGLAILDNHRLEASKPHECDQTFPGNHYSKNEYVDRQKVVHGSGQIQKGEPQHARLLPQLQRLDENA